MFQFSDIIPDFFLIYWTHLCKKKNCCDHVTLNFKQRILKLQMKNSLSILMSDLVPVVIIAKFSDSMSEDCCS
jgi:hypothetical protein